MNKDNLEYLKSNDIDVESSIQLLGDIDTYNEILNDFAQESGLKVERLKKSMESKNLNDYSIDSHSLKSDSKYLGFKKLAKISYEHELKSKENDYEYIVENFEQLSNEYDRVIGIVNNYLEGLK